MRENSVLIIVAKHFLREGFDNIIKNSEEAERSLLKHLINLAKDDSEIKLELELSQKTRERIKKLKESINEIEDVFSTQKRLSAKDRKKIKDEIAETKRRQTQHFFFGSSDNLSQTEHTKQKTAIFEMPNSNPIDANQSLTVSDSDVTDWTDPQNQQVIIYKPAINFIPTAKYIRDDLSFQEIKKKLDTAQEDIKNLFKTYHTAANQMESDLRASINKFFRSTQVESDLDALINNFFKPLQEIMDQSDDSDSLSVADRKIDLDTTNEPLDIFLCHVAMYRAHVLFDNHNTAIMKHSDKHTDRKISIIKAQVCSYYKNIHESSHPTQKANVLKTCITLINTQARELDDKYRYKFLKVEGYQLKPGDGPRLMPDRLSFWTDQAAGLIANRWLIEHMPDMRKTCFRAEEQSTCTLS